MKQTLLLALLVFTFNQTFSQIINPISATTTATNITGSLNASYDQTGLINPSSTASNHSGSRISNAFSCNCSKPVFDFDLGATYPIDGLIFWNAGNSGDAVIFGSDSVNTVQFYSSLDGTNFSEITGAPSTFTRDETGGMSNAELSPQPFQFANVNASFIRMEVLTTFNAEGTDFTAFSEIAFTANGILSTNQLFLNNTISLYPNPSSEFIQINGLTKTKNYTIFSVLGSEINSGVISDNDKINIQGLTNGLYFLKFENGNTLKFIKE